MKKYLGLKLLALSFLLSPIAEAQRLAQGPTVEVAVRQTIRGSGAYSLNRLFNIDNRYRGMQIESVFVRGASDRGTTNLNLIVDRGYAGGAQLFNNRLQLAYISPQYQTIIQPRTELRLDVVGDSYIESIGIIFVDNHAPPHDPYPPYPPYPPPHDPQPPVYDRYVTVKCSSTDQRQNQCEVGGRIVDVRLIRQFSIAPCNFNESWAFDRRFIYVARGCRGEFEARIR